MTSVKNILISQKEPVNMAPYSALSEAFGVNIDFVPFFLVEPLTSLEFRAQRINILSYTAITFSSRHAIDAFFELSSELRVKIPETMKYFCTTEAVAMYLQKHIVYRKRKIFFGDGTPQSVLSLIGTKHSAEKFLVTTSDSSSSEMFTKLFDEKGLDYKTAVFIKSVPQNLSGLDLSNYDLAVFYNPSDVKSLYHNFPDFQQGKLKVISYGKSIVKALEDSGIDIAIKAPTPQATSAAKAIELYLKTIDK